MQCLQIYRQLDFVLALTILLYQTRNARDYFDTVDQILQNFAAVNTLVVKADVEQTFNKHITSSLINKKGFTQLISFRILF